MDLTAIDETYALDFLSSDENEELLSIKVFANILKKS